MISDKDSKAEIYFYKGFIHQASSDNLIGEQAFYEVLSWGQGQFQFQPAESVSIPREIHKDAMQLLMEGLRRLDEDRVRLSWSESSSENL